MAREMGRVVSLCWNKLWIWGWEVGCVVVAVGKTEVYWDARGNG